MNKLETQVKQMREHYETMTKNVFRQDDVNSSQNDISRGDKSVSFYQNPDSSCPNISQNTMSQDQLTQVDIIINN
jgi:hypothetical protein